MGFINPAKILRENLELKRNMLAADFGCGAGEWAIPLAEALECGKVYAIDLLEEPLSAVRSKARIKKLQNIEIVKDNVEKIITRLLANSMDVVLITNLLFQVEDKKAIFAEAYRVMKPGARLLVVDWNEDARIGPAQKVKLQELKDLAQSVKLSLRSEFSAGGFHYGFIFEKGK